MLPKHPWLQKCIERLEELPQIKATAIVEPGYLEGALADGILTIYTPQNQVQYIVEIKSKLTIETLDVVILYFNHLKQRLGDNQKPLLVTDILSDEVVEELIRIDIEFIDTSGNIYINNSLFYILIKNSSFYQKKTSSPTFNTNTLKVVYAILKKPKILLFSRDEIAEVAGVDINAVEVSLDSLFKLNYLQQQYGGRYKIENYTKLLERWDMGYLENLRSELVIDTFSPIRNIQFSDFLFQSLDIVSGYKILVGGEFGASALFKTAYLQPTSIVLHIPNQLNYRIITTQLRLKPNVQGNITIIKQFSSYNFYENNDMIADPLLIRAELLLYPDERLKETATRIYNEYIFQIGQMAETL
ncbi:hypothetical protein Cylst_4598 [Cylindrospermum stagnale PCC 7417]|uniref:Uncharacterized protein n=1 Tax=Cylindrospermum stagnale PCC 7417 TaxID=56107 RepID=K9X3K8_9NOST|nr:type IV toxin-antitoxin system AbiEi family antitoxin [Cylindrospermum stagnale]AFZ26669.1 hypothetical protein Cylst_4598 [Cylindrospermum stagnale PCC 7417]